MNVLQCSAPGCIAIADSNPRRAWEDPQTCAKHRQQSRQRAGACLNCGAELEAQPELNALTGRQLRRQGVPVFVLACAAGCGYTRRTRP